MNHHIYLVARLKRRNIYIKFNIDVINHMFRQSHQRSPNRTHCAIPSSPAGPAAGKLGREPITDETKRRIRLLPRDGASQKVSECVRVG